MTSAITMIDEDHIVPARPSLVRLYMSAPPAHLIFKGQQSPRQMSGNASIHRSLRVDAEDDVNDFIGMDHHYQEVSLYFDEFVGAVPHDQVDLTPLRRVGHSLRILNLEMTNNLYCYETNYQLLLTKLAEAAGGRRRESDGSPSDFSSDLVESQFTSVRRVCITDPYPRFSTTCTPLDVSLLLEAYPNLTHLDLLGPIRLSFDSGTMRYHQLHHLSTSLPNTFHSSDNENLEFMMAIIFEVRQLESLHLILHTTQMRVIPNGYFIHLLALSSANLTEVTFSRETTHINSPDDWLTDDPGQREYLYDWLIELHLIWQMIQPTHPLPFEQIALTTGTVTSMFDLFPLVTTFIRHPFHRLPYLKQHYHFDHLRHQSLFHWVITKLTSLSSHIHQWFQSVTHKKPPVPRTEGFATHVRLEWLDELSARSHAIRDYLPYLHPHLPLTDLQQPQPQLQRWQPTTVRIETRTHFRMILQLEHDWRMG